jgi:MFS family permease
MLYFAEGAPIGFIWWTLPTLLRGAGVEVTDITALTAMVVLPWALKFAWAPLVDTLTSERFTHRAWIIAAQMAMAATLVPLLFVDWGASLSLLTVLLVLHALAAATQDVAVDALSIAIIPPGERGSLNGWMQAGMLLGRALFGGGALLLGSALSPAWMVGAMIAVLVVSPALLLLADLPSVPPRRGGAFRQFLRDGLAVLKLPATWVALLFAVSGEATFKGVGSVVGPYLVDRGVGEDVVGLFFGVVSVSAMVIGALAGGRVADRVGRRPAIVGGQLLVAGAVLTLGLWGGGGAMTALAWCALALFYLGVGLFTASSFALFMDMTEPRLGATQFSAYMGMTNLCEAWSARVVGSLATSQGYGTAFPVAAAMGTAALLLLHWLRYRQRNHE